MLYDMFPLMKTLYNSEAKAATECQDLMGMSFRTFHFDGAVRGPGYLAWLMDCDMRETYTFHRRVLKLRSGTARRFCGISRRRCTCLPSMHSLTLTRTPNSCGVTVIQPR
jgi:hypothetical protein